MTSHSEPTGRHHIQYRRDDITFRTDGTTLHSVPTGLAGYCTTKILYCHLKASGEAQRPGYELGHWTVCHLFLVGQRSISSPSSFFLLLLLFLLIIHIHIMDMRKSVESTVHYAFLKKNSIARNKVIIRLRSSGMWLSFSFTGRSYCFWKPAVYILRAEAVANINNW